MTSKQTQVFRTEEALSVVDTLKLALEALKSSNKLINGTGTKFGLAGAMDGYYSGCFDVEGNNKLLTDAITAIKEALAQPEQEPIGEVVTAGVIRWKDKYPSLGTKLYTTPPTQQSCSQRKPLTYEQIDSLRSGYQSGRIGSFVGLCRAIEAAHGIKEKNT